MGKKKSHKKTSKYIGVHRLNTKFTKWLANITIKKKSIYLGCFSSEKEAASAYDDLSMKYYNDRPNKT